MFKPGHAALTFFLLFFMLAANQAYTACQPYYEDISEFIIRVSDPFIYPTTAKEYNAQEPQEALEDFFYKEPIKGIYEENQYEETTSIWKSKGIYESELEDCSFGSKNCAVKGMYHTGTDWLFGYSDETDLQNSRRPIYAINDGILVYAGPHREICREEECRGKCQDSKKGLGYAVIIKHIPQKGSKFILPADSLQEKKQRTSKAIYSYYLHLDEDVIPEPPNQNNNIGFFIKKGEKVGYTYHLKDVKSKKSDGTGQLCKTNYIDKAIAEYPEIIDPEYFTETYSYCPHLHFEIWEQFMGEDARGYDNDSQFKKGSYISSELFLAQDHYWTLWDIEDDNPYKEEIFELGKLDIVNGDDEDGAFNPGKEINRAEFTKMLVLAVRYARNHDIAEQLDPIPARENVKDIFFDVQSKSWYEDLVYEAYKAGLVDGYKSEKNSEDTVGKVGFGPENKIQRCEGVKMVADAFNLFEEDVATYVIPSGFKRKYNDIERGSWYEKYVARCYDLGIMGEYAYNTRTFEPAAAMRKDEAAALIYNAYLKSLNLR
ncbi:MAG: M23 family metallopeptidase [Candidatus Electrothrix sp. AR5]|nr:M23 family metallopeptidase [Candidatus Electrothrix sp. AR5]